MLERLHARLGDFWWYSLMLFCACRAADLLNAFVGLWLVPKYVDPMRLIMMPHWTRHFPLGIHAAEWNRRILC